jgi:hypothetical protein
MRSGTTEHCVRRYAGQGAGEDQRTGSEVQLFEERWINIA